MVRWSGVLAAAALVLGVAGSARATASDQAALDAAIESFNERMTAAGWVSQGPGDGVLGSGDGEDDESSESDEAMAACFGGLPDLIQGLEDDEELPGEIARSESDEFAFMLATDTPETTESLFSIPDEEEAAAFALSVDGANAALLAQFLDVLGAKETSECVTNALEAEMAPDPESTDSMDIPMEFEVDASTRGDLGVGEHSAEMTFGFSIDFLGIPFIADGRLMFASTGNHLVGVMHFVTGAAEPASGFDPLAELEALVDAIEA